MINIELKTLQKRKVNLIKSIEKVNLYKYQYSFKVLEGLKTELNKVNNTFEGILKQELNKKEGK